MTNKPSKANKPKKSNKPAFFAVFVIIALLAAGVGLVVQNAQYSTVNRNITRLNIPVLQSSVKSSTDGQSHNVQTKFFVDVDKKYSSTVKSQDLYAYLDDIMTTLDYDKINYRDGVEYIEDQVVSGLTAYYDEDTVKHIYITELYLGDSVQPLSAGSSEDDRVNSIFKGLFKNIN